MDYVSTRGQAPARRFSDILLEGLAPDGGLYVPGAYPQADLGFLSPKLLFTGGWHDGCNH